MIGTATEATTVIGLFGQMVNKYGMRPGDTLALWEGIRAQAERAERSGFHEGFRMAQTLLGAGTILDPIPAEAREEDPEQEAQRTDQGNDQAFVRMEQGKNGKKLHFNKIAGGMFGEYRKADIYVRNGNLFIYPTNDGAYTVTRSGSNGHVQICCADILDELVTKSGNYQVEKRDNHIIARVSIR